MKKIKLLLLATIVCSCVKAQQPEQADPGFTQKNIVPNIDLNCDPCKEPAIKITLPTATAITVYNNNTITYNQNITVAAVPVKLIRTIKTELTYFEFTPDSDDCFPCNKNSATFGNFGNSIISTQPGSGTGSHVLVFNFIPAKNPGTYPGSFIITLPPTVKCCQGFIRWCIKYIIEFDDCTVCSKTVCYEKKKTTVVVIPDTNPNRPN